MVGVCCGCIAKPASVQPRKTYNILNTQLFYGPPIRTDEALDSTLRRRIQKLQEYVQANPAKIPKVSRRLMRRIKATLQKPGDNLGYVKVAVYAYVYMLAHSTDDTSSYGPSFFAREILSGPDAVVLLLLKDMHIEMRTLGAELLAVFTKVQSQVDNKLDAIQDQIPQVCRAAQAALSADRKEQKLQETAERRRRGERLAVPNPLDLVARRNPVHVAALEVACLRCLVEVVALCLTSKVLPRHLTAIQAVTLDNLRQLRRGPLDVAAAEVDLSQSQLGILEPAFYEAMAIQKSVPQAWEPRQLAGRLLQLLGEFTRNVATVHKVLNSFHEYLDDQHRWQENDIVQELLQTFNSGGCHQFPIYASLLRHAASRRLSAHDASIVVGLAAEKGAALDERYSLTALALALNQMPKIWALQAHRAPKAMRTQALLDVLRAHLLPVTKDPHMLVQAAPVGLVATTSSSVMLAGGSATARPVAANGKSAVSVGNQASSSDTSYATEQDDTRLLQQQLAHLRAEVQSAVRLLASRVGTAAELCQVLVGVLGAVAAELGLVSSAGIDSTLEQTMDATAAPARESDGASEVRNRASLDVGRRLSDAHAVAVRRDEAGAGVAAMMLQCAAAATDAFMQQCMKLRGPSASEDSFSANLEHRLVLPGGVLPGSLVSSALPLLRLESEHYRWPTQQILLALLPAAHKGIGTDKSAAELAKAVLTEIWCDCHNQQLAARGKPDAVAATDQILRCCLRSSKPRPTVALFIAQALLQLQRRWSAEGYRGMGQLDASAAHAVLLMVNSQLAALAEASEHSGLLSQQLPLPPDSCSALLLTPRGLVATGAAADSTSSKVALAELEQQSLQPSRDLTTILLHTPALVSEYGDGLQQLLEQDLVPSGGGVVSEKSGRAETKQVAFNALLGRRVSSLRRDLVHVGELMRESISRLQDPTPASNLSAAPPAASFHETDQGIPSKLAGDGVPGDHAASHIMATPLSSTLPNNGAAKVDSGAAVHVATAANLPTQQKELQHPGAVAGLSQSSSLAIAGLATQHQPDAIDIEHIKLQGLKVDKRHTTISSQVAKALQQPVAAGTLVVRDVQISRIAGELEPVTI